MQTDHSRRRSMSSRTAHGPACYVVVRVHNFRAVRDPDGFVNKVHTGSNELHILHTVLAPPRDLETALAAHLKKRVVRSTLLLHQVASGTSPKQSTASSLVSEPVPAGRRSTWSRLCWLLLPCSLLLLVLLLLLLLLLLLACAAGTPALGTSCNVAARHTPPRGHKRETKAKQTKGVSPCPPLPALTLHDGGLGVTCPALIHHGALAPPSAEHSWPWSHHVLSLRRDGEGWARRLPGGQTK